MKTTRPSVDRAALRPIFLAVAVASLAACAAPGSPGVLSEPTAERPRTAFVHLFEWTWPAVARECEQFLGPTGYAAVQVSPPQEHAAGPQWYMRYQPVSYRLISRGGTRAEFVDMVERCAAVGVDIYVDAVLNHMTGVYAGRSIAGTQFGEYDYPGLYGYDDFHHCGRHGNDDIADFDDEWELHNCELVNLADLATATPKVRERLAGYLSDLTNIGVAGFRIDAAKHMPAADIRAILGVVDGEPWVFQEVIADGTGAFDRDAYRVNGPLTEFGYPPRLQKAFAGGELDALRDLGPGSGLLPGSEAVVFVDNHDTQRHHSDSVFNYKAGDRYVLANVFMLASPYGYPKVMSSFDFDQDRSDAGPPTVAPVAPDGTSCNTGWVCEHRHPVIAAMVGFRNATDGDPLVHWQRHGGHGLSFGRGASGHVVLNVADTPRDLRVRTDLADGRYRDLLAAGRTITVASGYFDVTVPPLGAVALLARP